MGEAPQAGAGIFPVQDHGEALPEHDCTRGFSLELACGQNRSLGKLGPNTSGNLAPATPDGLHDHRDESNALKLALLAGILIAALEILVLSKGSIRIPSRISHDL